MFDLHSAHLDTKVVELGVQLPLHGSGFLFYLFLHLVSIKIVDVEEIGSCLVLGASHILSHLLHLFKLFEKLIRLFTSFEYFVGRISSNLFELGL